MTLVRISLPDKEVILVGTAHISAESARLAQDTIVSEQPDVVGVELDEQRRHQLENERDWQVTDIGRVVQTGKTYLLLLNIFLANLQRRLGEQVKVKPGQEMLWAIQTARAHNIRVELLDRSIQVTMQRAAAFLSLREKFKLGYYLLSGFFTEHEALTAEKIEALKSEDMVSSLIYELGQTAPTLKRVLVDERDDFLAQKIITTPARKMVCIIGAGHLNGIRKRLENPAQTLQKTQLPLPRKNPLTRYLQWLIPALFILVFVWLLGTKGLQSGFEFIGVWILITGVCSAIGAALARSHLVTIVSAFLAAPFTTLHPLLASGWVAAGIEAKYKKPLVVDFQTLNTLNSYRDFEQNRVTHLLMVAAYTNLGSTIGVLVAVPYVIAVIG